MRLGASQADNPYQAAWDRDTARRQEQLDANLPAVRRDLASAREAYQRGLIPPGWESQANDQFVLYAAPFLGSLGGKSAGVLLRDLAAELGVGLGTELGSMGSFLSEAIPVVALVYLGMRLGWDWYAHDWIIDAAVGTSADVRKLKGKMEEWVVDRVAEYGFPPSLARFINREYDGLHEATARAFYQYKGIYAEEECTFWGTMTILWGDNCLTEANSRAKRKVTLPYKKLLGEIITGVALMGSAQERQRQDAERQRPEERQGDGGGGGGLVPLLVAAGAAYAMMQG